MHERYLKMLRETKDECHGDPESWHQTAEGVMLDLLREAGFVQFADEYEEQSKNWWYA